MDNLTITKENALKAYQEGCPDVKKVLSNLFGDKTFVSEKITDRIKTYEDACDILGLGKDNQVKVSHDMSKDEKSIKAYAKLIVVIRALNEGWEPDWDNSSQYKYYNYWDMRKGFSFFGVAYDWTFTAVGSRLCFKTEELSKYAAKQFEQLYREFYTI